MPMMFFHFLKIIFDISIKTIQNIQIILNFSTKKNQIFWERSRVPKRNLRACLAMWLRVLFK
jgi:hypothetical protein